MISPAPTAGLYILKVYTRKPCVSASWGRHGSSPLDGSRTSTGQSKPLPANCPELFFHSVPETNRPPPLTPALGATFDRRHAETQTSGDSGGRTRRPVTAREENESRRNIRRVKRRESVGLRGWENRRAEPPPPGGKRGHVTRRQHCSGGGAGGK